MHDSIQRVVTSMLQRANVCATQARVHHNMSRTAYELGNNPSVPKQVRLLEQRKAKSNFDLAQTFVQEWYDLHVAIQRLTFV